jgi:nitrogen-specific signal transduction histidine kinase
MRDITRHKQLEQQLVQSQKMEAIGQLTGGLAHDFNNLLGVVLGNLELMEDMAKDTPRLLQHIHVAEKAARSGASLTKRLLAFACKQTLTPTCISVNDLITEMQELLARTLGARIELSVNLSPDAPLVIVDRGELENVLLNLAINSRDAINGAGRIEVSTAPVCFDSQQQLCCAGKAEPGYYVKISVADNGAGMSQATLGKLFEPFFTTKRAGEGTGLGLSMIYGIVKQSKGCIDVASELGNVTTVDIYIPQALEQQSAEFNKAQQHEGSLQEPVVQDVQPVGTAVTGGETILVVDDTEDLLLLAEMILEQNGYHVLTAVNASQALEYIDGDDPIDMVLTDIVMPGEMNGVELCERINENHPQIKVAFTSGYSADVLKAKSGVSVAGRLINKPYKSQELLASVRNVLDGCALN